jgi:chromosome segregation ATPase
MGNGRREPLNHGQEKIMAYGCGVAGCMHESRRKALDCTRRIANVNSQEDNKILANENRMLKEDIAKVCGERDEHFKTIEALGSETADLKNQIKLLSMSIENLNTIIAGKDAEIATLKTPVSCETVQP